MRRVRSRSHSIVAVCLCVVVFAVFLPLSAEATEGFWDNPIKNTVWTIVSQLGGMLVWLGGGLLDTTIRYFILDYGRIFQSQGLGLAVNNLWTVVRDLFNLTFIFALVYIGFRMILDSDDSGAKKAIVNLVIAALLVNFSLFFTKAIVDFTNITATQVANVIYGAQGPGSSGTISATFSNAMGLSSLWGDGGASQGAITSANIGTVTWSYILGTFIICIVAAFSFIAGAALLTVRFIVITYFMVISPIMFIGRVFPFLQSWQSNFWSTFLKNSFFAPAFLLMLYFSLYVLGQIRGMVPTGGLSRQLGPGAGDVNALMMLVLVAGFLLASVIIGQKMGVVGAGVAVNMGNKLRSKVQNGLVNGALAAPRWAGRNTLGAIGRNWDKKMEQSGVRSDSFRRGWAQSMANAKFGGSVSAKSRHDAKEAAARFAARTKEVQGIENAILAFEAKPSDETKIAMERAVAGASTEQITKLLNTHTSGPVYETLLRNMTTDQVAAVAKAKDEDFNDSTKAKIARDRQGTLGANLADRARAGEREKAESDARAAGLSREEVMRAGEEAAKNATLAQGIKEATIDELRELGSKTIIENIKGLKFSQIEDIKKSTNKFTPTEKELIIKAFNEEIEKEFIATSSANMGKFFGKYKESEVAQLPKGVFFRSDGQPHAFVLPHLTTGVLDKMADKETIKTGDRARLRSAIEDAYTGARRGSDDEKKLDKLVTWLDTPRGRIF